METRTKLVELASASPRWLRAIVKGPGMWTAVAAALMIHAAPADAQSFSLDDNPQTPIASSPATPPIGLGAEDEFGQTVAGNAGLAPSPSLVSPVPPSPGPAIAGGDGTIISPNINNPLFFGPNGSWVDAFSVNHPTPTNDIWVHFSVDRLTSGTAGSVLQIEAAANQQPGDIYQSTATFQNPANFVGNVSGPGWGGALPSAGLSFSGSNVMAADESMFGLTVTGAVGQVTGPGAQVAPAQYGSHDNVDAFDWASQVSGGPAPFPGLYNTHAYFAIAPDEGKVVGKSAAHIYDVPALTTGTGSNIPYARANALGLDQYGPNTDSIDALVVFDNGTPGGQQHGGPGAEPGLDFALFSLAPGSASLTAYGLSASDVFFTDFNNAFATYAYGLELGISPQGIGEAFAGDNMDAMEIIQVPEPATAALMLSLTLACVARRRR